MEILQKTVVLTHLLVKVKYSRRYENYAGEISACIWFPQFSCLSMKNKIKEGKQVTVCRVGVRVEGAYI